VAQTEHLMPSSISGARLVAIVCAAQVLVQMGTNFWSALLPEMMQLWHLSNSDAGWITAALPGAYMLAVPILVTLTDRVDPKRIYLFGVACLLASHFLFGLLAEGFWSALVLRTLAGIGWAGTYMTGLKLLADEVDARLMSRAVTGHAASIGVSGALSFVVGDLIASHFGWRMTFVFAGVSVLVAWLAVAMAIPSRTPAPPPSGKRSALFDFRPVLRNRSAMAYAIGYCVHTLEMGALRGWGVAFLAWVAASTATTEGLFSPTVIVTTLALIGTVASVVGNEAAIRFGRRRLVATAMVLSIVVALVLAMVGSTSYLLAVGLLLVYGPVVWLDSSSLTAGTAGAAEPSRRGATLAVHSMLGYAGGFVGPLAVGWTLDLAGGMSPLGWGLSYLLVAVLMALALAAFIAIRPRELEGDRQSGGG
jgi:MFS family permease